ncbi:helix-turn-helix domain-containing protein [Saccharopolyspora sp. ID03-671]|uniref:helix-turn-helix domain-containing protein n=1 Tax=Saccharopolyspora sp. ID03-671 TaxID=3073066 RepID=UPI003873B39D
MNSEGRPPQTRLSPTSPRSKAISDGQQHNEEPRRETPELHNLHLFTPAEAAKILSVRESWLRRKAGNRAVPCTFLGKHLRFSTENLREIARQGSQEPCSRRGRPRWR